LNSQVTVLTALSYSDTSGNHLIHLLRSKRTFSSFTITVFWDVTKCNFVDLYRSSGGFLQSVLPWWGMQQVATKR